MKYKDLRNLNKLELLELVYAMRTELDKAEGENRKLKRELRENKKELNELLYNSRNMARQVSKLCNEVYIPYIDDGDK